MRMRCAISLNRDDQIGSKVKQRLRIVKTKSEVYQKLSTEKETRNFKRIKILHRFKTIIHVNVGRRFMLSRYS